LFFLLLVMVAVRLYWVCFEFVPVCFEVVQSLLLIKKTIRGENILHDLKHEREKIN